MEHLPFHVMHMSERVNIKPYQLDPNIDMHISVAAQHKLESRCSRHGYVRPKSVIVVSRSIGYHRGCHFHGEITFDIEVVADVCRPLKGDTIFCTVVNLNRMGLLAKAGELPEIQSHVLHVYAILQHHNNAEFFDDPNLVEGATILVSVVGSKSKLKDNKIDVIGKILKVYRGDDLQDYAKKIVKLPETKEPISKLDFDTADKPAGARTSLGHEMYIESLKSILGHAQDEAREKLRCVMDDDDANIERRWGRICSEARSLTNEFELVYPPYAYESRPPVVVVRPLNRAFFKMWEMIADFRLIDSDKGKIITAHTAESPGSFVEAVLKWREGLVGDGAQHKPSDVAFVMSLKQPTAFSPGTPGSDNINRLADLYPNVRIRHGGEVDGALPSGLKKRQGDGTGDIFKIGNILDFAADVQAAGGADIVTSDLGFDFDLVEDVREQCMFFPLFAQMVSTLSCQKKGGHAVIKIFDIFTKVTAKMLAFISSYYREAYLTKPFTSRSGNPEKYLVLKHFKGITKKQLSDAIAIYNKWQLTEPHIGAAYLQNDKFVSDVPDVDLKPEMVDVLYGFNSVNVNQRQVRTLAQMIRVLRNANGPSDRDRELAKAVQTRSARAWYFRYMKVSSQQPNESHVHGHVEEEDDRGSDDDDSEDPESAVSEEKQLST